MHIHIKLILIKIKSNEAKFTDKKIVNNSCVNYNKLISIEIDIPHNKYFCPVLDLYCWEESDVLKR